LIPSSSQADENLILHPICSFVADTPPVQEGRSFSLPTLGSVALEPLRTFASFSIFKRGNQRLET
jgi:hypothetical protein